MKKILITLILCLFCVTAFAQSAALSHAQWAEPFTTDKSNQLLSTVNSPQVNNNKQAVSYSYALDSQQSIDFEQKPFVENSKQYWLDSTAEKLLQGIDLPVSGGDTVIRISPLTNDKTIQLRANMIEIHNNGERKNIAVFADSAQLKATGAAFTDNSIALKVNATAGKLHLVVKGFSESTPFVVHVLEPNSPYLLALKSAQATYAVNEKIRIDSQFLSATDKLDAELSGYISRPDGSVLGKLTFNQDTSGKYMAEINATGGQGLANGLWEVHVFAKSQDKGIEIMRDAQTSFAVNLNTAKFDGQLNTVKTGIQLGIQVGLAGRYEAKGVLMGHDAKTQALKPIAMTMAAAWLNTGTQTITIPIDEKLIQESGLVAPFVLKNIELNNQTYLAPVQTVKAGIHLF